MAAQGVTLIMRLFTQGTCTHHTARPLMHDEHEFKAELVENVVLAIFYVVLHLHALQTLTNRLDTRL